MKNMADTLQIIQWTLEQACALRTQDAIHNISAAGIAVGRARSLAESAARPEGQYGIFGGIYVTGTTDATVPEHLHSRTRTILDRLFDRGTENTSQKVICSDYPESGYIIADEFKQLGGLEGLKAMCRNCPANAGEPIPAGCAGYLRQRPWCHETQGYLEKIVSRLGLESTIAETFVKTTPIWFGLWTHPVLSPKQAALMETLLSALMGEWGDVPSDWLDTREREQFQLFVTALRIAQGGKAILHVQMAPPGHTDFGWYTIFPHCPLCKAEADVERWKRSYPAALYTCKVCGTVYSPAEHASAERMDSNSPPNLRELLGADRFGAFAKSYLISRGMLEADAAETVELSEARVVTRQEQLAQSNRDMRAHWRYIEESLYAGFKLESLVDPKNSSEVIGKGFRAGDFEKILQRCAERKIGVNGMHHSSILEEKDRRHPPFSMIEEKKRFDPFEIFQKWRSEGCDEMFGAHFKVPRELIEQYEKDNPVPS
ncbi:MAG TPA: hypothetical protein VGN88_00155 [Phycisphaerae bacterium]|jgi:hypothetical protein